MPETRTNTRSHSPERKKGLNQTHKKVNENKCPYCHEIIIEDKREHLLKCKITKKYQSFSTKELMVLYDTLKRNSYDNTEKELHRVKLKREIEKTYRARLPKVIKEEKHA